MMSKQHWKDINMADFNSKVGNFKTTSEFSDSFPRLSENSKIGFESGG